MDLYINDEKVDFTLETEKTLADVVHSLERWLADRKLAIVDLAVDGERFGRAELEGKKDRPIDDVGEIRVAASDFVRLEMEGVGALTSFFETLKSRLEVRDEAGLAEVLHGYPQTDFMLRFILPESEALETGRQRADLEKMFAGTTAGMIKLWDKAMVERATALCDYFLQELRRIHAGFVRLGDSTRKIAAETTSKLRASAERLKDVSVLLQAGKDGEAMQSIASFTELAQLFLHLVSDVFALPAAESLTVDGVGLESYSQTLNAHLRELVEAFEKKDYILIGDLCEYEIAPKIIALIDTVERTLSALSSAE